SYEPGLSAEAVSAGADPKTDLMTWAFVGSSTDPEKRTLETILFFFATTPDAVLTMMDGLDETNIGPADRRRLERQVAEMRANRRAVLIGHDRLAAIHKQVGDRIKVYSFNYKDIEFEVDIIGELPRGQYDNNAIMNLEYFRRSLDDYERKHNQRHP